MANFDYDLLGEAIGEAPTAGYGPRVNYGKLTISKVEIIAWSNRKMKARPFKAGDKADVSKGEYLQITFNVAIEELNPALEFTYDRRVDVKKSSDTTKTDWSEIVEPALLSVVGKDWHKKLGKGVYAEVEDVPTVDVKRRTWTSEDGVEHTRTVPRVTAVYKSKAECEAARATRFAKSESNEDESSEESNGIPDNVIADTRALLASLGEDQTRTVLAGKPFGEYDVDELITAAGVPF